MTTDARREQYARIIFDRDCGPENWDNTFYLMVRDACYETADAILALEGAEIARLTAEVDKTKADLKTHVDATVETENRIIDAEFKATEMQHRAEAAERALTTWQPIETRPESDKPCWIGDPVSQTMLVAYPGKRMPKGVWYILWSDRMVPWPPKIWMPLPAPPAAPTKHEAEDV